MECPECKQEIGNARYCGCGWGRQTKSKNGEPFVFIQCSHLACKTHAVTSVNTKTGWAKFCPAHYASYYLDRAEETCEKMGLKTTQQKRDWVKKTAKTLSAKLRPDYLREPGEDEEYKHTY